MTLGYIFFELSNYKTAIRYLIDIAPEFYDYPEVLLTIGWSAFKLKDYQTALLALNNLVDDYENFYNLEEVNFVLGQCYLNLGDYDSAIKKYSNIIERTPKTDDFETVIELAKNELAVQEKNVEELKTQLLVLESRLLDTIKSKSGNGVPDYVKQERTRLKQQHELFMEEIIQERRDFEAVIGMIAELKAQIEKAERQKNWRSYAEFGRGRAMYLKGISGEW